jgi:hypothetical protein
MWICPRCNTENKDGNAVCDGCSAARSAGRFGSAASLRDSRPASGAYAPPVQSLPRSQTAVPKPVPAPAAPLADTRMSPAAATGRAPRSGGGLLAGLGVLLAILLPASGILLAIRLYSALSPQLTLLLFGENPQPPVVTLAVYAAAVCVASLLLLLPGALALSHSRLHAQLARIERIL